MVALHSLEFALHLERLNVVSHIVKVNCKRFNFKKFDALNPDLDELVDCRLQFSCLRRRNIEGDPIDTALLNRFVSLSHYDLI